MNILGSAFIGLISLAVAVFMIVAMWKMFVKAGQPGWACIIPIYNTYILLQIAGKPGWWLVLYLIPVVSFIISIIVFCLGWFVGSIMGYALFSWALRQDGYYIKYDGSKELGQGRYQILQELDLDFGSDDNG